MKKGFYVLGEKYGKIFSRGVIANLIYGPSYISLESALAYYDLIPEKVETVLNMTTKRNKTFLTPIGQFTYKYLSEKKYAAGIYLVQISEQETFHIATKEKAICDLLVLQKNLSTIKDIEFFLFEDLRMDPKIPKDLNLKLIDQIQTGYKKKVLQKFFDLVINFQKGCP